MNTITTSNLSARQIKDIHALIDICRFNDNINGYLFLDSQTNVLTDIPCFFLTYDGDTLCSILTIFIPNEYECEIYAYTLPKYRQRHLFAKLLENALDSIQSSTIEMIYLIAEPNSTSSKTAIAINASYEYSEYILSYDMHNTPMPEHTLTISISEENELHTAHFTFNSTPVALSHLYIHENYVSIFDFEVLEDFRGKGYGKESLLLLVEYLIKHGINSISLHVSSTNKKAHKLYTTYGFYVKEQIDYFSISNSGPLCQ